MRVSSVKVPCDAIKRAEFCLNLCYMSYLDKKPTGQCPQTGAAFNIYTQEDSTAFIVYRGTQLTSLADWASNLLFGKVPGGDHHWGWFVSYKSIEYDLRTRLAELRVSQLCHVGHSKGGSMAQIAAALLGGECHTFGAPPALRGLRIRMGGYGWVTATDPVPSVTKYLGFHWPVMQVTLPYRNNTFSPLEGHYLPAYRAALEQLSCSHSPAP